MTEEEIRASLIELGRQLALLRKAAQLTQHELAARIVYSHSTIANIEISRNSAPLVFWLAADRAVRADGVLVKAAMHLADLKRAYLTQQATGRRAAVRLCEHRSDCVCDVFVVRWTGRHARALRLAAGLNAAAFAVAVNVEVGQVAAWERPSARTRH